MAGRGGFCVCCWMRRLLRVSTTVRRPTYIYRQSTINKSMRLVGHQLWNVGRRGGVREKSKVIWVAEKKNVTNICDNPVEGIFFFSVKGIDIFSPPTYAAVRDFSSTTSSAKRKKIVSLLSIAQSRTSTAYYVECNQDLLSLPPFVLICRTWIVNDGTNLTVFCRLGGVNWLESLISMKRKRKRKMKRKEIYRSQKRPKTVCCLWWFE